VGIRKEMMRIVKTDFLFISYSSLGLLV